MTDNRTALVTGANKGIGLEIARGLSHSSSASGASFALSTAASSANSTLAFATWPVKVAAPINCGAG